MNFEQIITTVYQKQFIDNLFSLKYDEENNVVIYVWNVPNIPQPTYDEIMAFYTPQLEIDYNTNQFVNLGTPLIANYIDSIAQERQYDSAVSCVSYFMSTNVQWKNEAIAFIAWRDSVFAYTMEQVALMATGARSIPTFEEFKTELPKITW